MPIISNAAPKLPDLNAQPLSEEALALQSTKSWMSQVFLSVEFKQTVFGNPRANRDDFSNAFFRMDENGKLEAASTMWEESSHYNDAMWSNRMFIKDSTGALRQLQLEKSEGNGPSFSLSAPMTSLRSTIEPPKAPFFLKYLLFFIFWDELAEYSRQSAAYKAITSAEAEESFRSQVDPQLLAAEANAQPQQEQEQPQQEQPQQARQSKVKKPTAEELNAFEQRLKDEKKLWMRSVSDISYKPAQFRTEEKILELMMERIKGNMAKKVLNAIEKEPENRETILTAAMLNYDETLEGIRNFLPKTVDPDTIHAVGTKIVSLSVTEKLDFIADTAQDNYFNYLQNGDNFKQLLYFTEPEIKAMKEAGTYETGRFGEPYGMKKAVDAPKAEQNAPAVQNNEDPPAKEAAGPGLNP